LPATGSGLRVRGATGHTRVNIEVDESHRYRGRAPMPSLFRFLTVVALIGGAAYAGLYASAVLLEPDQVEVSKQVFGVAIKNP
jgi:hypothetical protein